MKKAWVENGRVRDVASRPDEQFHAGIARNYSVDVADDILPGASLVAGVWTNAAPPAAAPPLAPEKGPVAMAGALLHFSAAERVALRSPARDLVKDALAILTDARITSLSRVQWVALLAQLAVENVVTPARQAVLEQVDG